MAATGLAPSHSTPSVYYLISAALVALWLGALVVFRTRSPRVIGSGPEEYRRIFGATLRLFGLIAIVSLLFRLDLARLYLAIAFPVGLVGLLVSRWCWRKGDRRQAGSRRVPDVGTGRRW